MVLCSQWEHQISSNAHTEPEASRWTVPGGRVPTDTPARRTAVTEIFTFVQMQHLAVVESVMEEPVCPERTIMVWAFPHYSRCPGIMVYKVKGDQHLSPVRLLQMALIFKWDCEAESYSRKGSEKCCVKLPIVLFLQVVI